MQSKPRRRITCRFSPGLFNVNLRCTSGWPKKEQFVGEPRLDVFPSVIYADPEGLIARGNLVFSSGGGIQESFMTGESAQYRF